MIVLRQLFWWLLKKGWIRRDPTRSVSLPSAQARKDLIRPEEVGPVLDACFATSPIFGPVATATALGGGLRRTFAVLLQDAGAPDSVIAQALGHSARGVTQFNYLPRRDSVVAQWVNKIDVRVTALEDGLLPICYQQPRESTTRSAALH